MHEHASAHAPYSMHSSGGGTAGAVAQRASRAPECNVSCGARQAAFTVVFSFQVGVITSYWDTQVRPRGGRLVRVLRRSPNAHRRSVGRVCGGPDPFEALPWWLVASMQCLHSSSRSAHGMREHPGAEQRAVQRGAGAVALQRSCSSAPAPLSAGPAVTGGLRMAHHPRRG